MAVVPPNVRIHRDSRVMNQQTKKKRNKLRLWFNNSMGLNSEWDSLKHGWENPTSHGGVLRKSSTRGAFSIARFDYQRVPPGKRLQNELENHHC